MKKQEKRIILILLIITIIVIGIFIFTRSGNKQEENKTETIQEGNTTYVQVTDKEVDEIEVTNIEITEENGDAVVTANVTNNTKEEKEEFTVKIKLKNEKGEVIRELGALIGKTQPGETRQIRAIVGGVNIKEIKDIEIIK